MQPETDCREWLAVQPTSDNERCKESTNQSEDGPDQPWEPGETSFLQPRVKPSEWPRESHHERCSKQNKRQDFPARAQFVMPVQEYALQLLKTFV
jgi:hypothetical protein